MPSKSKQQQKFFGIVRGIQKGSSKGSKAAKDVAKRMDIDDVEKYASTKHKGLPKKVSKESLESLENGIRNMVKEFMTESHHDKREGKMAKYDAKEIAQDAADVFKMIDKDMDLPEWLEAKITIAAHNMNTVKDYLTHHQSDKVEEAKKRDYKAEYKKFQSSTKSKKYRAELNKYNRQKGTYGNGDGKDASHKGGKIVGFEKESVNRGRREKSRLKKEGKLNEKKQLYVVASTSGHLYTGDKGVTEKQALKIMDRFEKVGMNLFMLGVQYWNKPHKYNKKKIMVKEAGSLGGPISYGSDIGSSYIAPKRDTSGGMKTFHQKFSSPEARSIIDGQLKMMAKELRKVQNKVIKTWMQGAKSGAIDFFDIIRGLKTGDVSRAYPYEVDFLVNVLTKDKIIDRFRSYFKGKKGKPRK